MVAASLPPGSHRQYHPYHLGLSHGALFLPPLPLVPLTWCPPPPPPFFATWVTLTVPHLFTSWASDLLPPPFCHLGFIDSTTLISCGKGGPFTWYTPLFLPPGSHPQLHPCYTHHFSMTPLPLGPLTWFPPPLPLYHLGHITSCTLAIRVILTVPPLPLGPLTWCPCHMDHINGITLTTQPVPPPFLPPGSHPQLLPDLHYYTLLTYQVKSPVIAWWVKLLAPLCILTHITIARLASLVIPLMLTLPCKSHLLGYSLPPSPLSYFPLPILR